MLQFKGKNHYIEQLAKIKIRIRAGKIIPALITSTSSIVVLLSLYKYTIYQNNNCKKFWIGIIDLLDNTSLEYRIKTIYLKY